MSTSWPRKNSQRTQVVAMRLTQDELEKLKETQETLKKLGTTGNNSETLRLIYREFDLRNWKRRVLERMNNGENRYERSTSNNNRQKEKIYKSLRNPIYSEECHQETE